jgi:hypothetical protein
MSNNLRPLEEVDLVDWVALAQPDWNTPSSVPRAIRRLALARTEEDSWAAYNDVLFAVGNNHAGTYHPIALAALPFLACILRSPSPVARQRVLDILIDLSDSFVPAPGHEFIGSLNTAPQSLQIELRNTIRVLWAGEKATVMVVANPRELALAAQLDDCLRDPVEEPPAAHKT